MLQRQGDLDKGGKACRLLEMSDIRLHRTDRAETAPVRPSPERPGQRIDFQRIADDRSGAVTFDIAKVGGQTSASSIASSMARVWPATLEAV